MADTLEWETLDSAVPYSCPGFDIRCDEVRLPDGSETTYDYLTEADSVVVIPFISQDTLVLIEEWRQAVSRVNLGFPAGGVEPIDADLAAAARRELTEETGYQAEEVEQLVTVEPANGVADAVHHYFVAYRCTPEGEQVLDHDESIRVTTIAIDELRSAIDEGQVRDGRTVLGLLYYDRLQAPGSEGP